MSSSSNSFTKTFVAPTSNGASCSQTFTMLELLLYLSKHPTTTHTLDLGYILTLVSKDEFSMVVVKKGGWNDHEYERMAIETCNRLQWKGSTSLQWLVMHNKAWVS